jgi:hypothetical protein
MLHPVFDGKIPLGAVTWQYEFFVVTTAECSIIQDLRSAESAGMLFRATQGELSLAASEVVLLLCMVWMNESSLPDPKFFVRFEGSASGSTARVFCVPPQAFMLFPEYMISKVPVFPFEIPYPGTLVESRLTMRFPAK